MIKTNIYKATHQFLLANAQAGNSRLVTIRNGGESEVVVTRLRLILVQIGAHTAAVLDQLIAWKLTGFTAVDTSDESALSALPLNSASPAASLAELNGVTASGVANGMTGGTLSKVSPPISLNPIWFLATLPTAGPVPMFDVDVVRVGDRPIILNENEGISIENGNVLGAAAGARGFVEIEWEERIRS